MTRVGKLVQLVQLVQFSTVSTYSNKLTLNMAGSSNHSIISTVIILTF